MSERSKLEQRTRELLDESAEALDGHIRSRLTQARQAALAEPQRSSGPRSRTWWIFAPVGGLVAAAVLAVMFWPRAAVIDSLPVIPPAPQVAEDLELILGEDPFDFTDDEDALLGT